MCARPPVLTTAVRVAVEQSTKAAAVRSAATTVNPGKNVMRGATAPTNVRRMRLSVVCHAATTV
jgi:hypothetical protein